MIVLAFAVVQSHSRRRRAVVQELMQVYLLHRQLAVSFEEVRGFNRVCCHMPYLLVAWEIVDVELLDWIFQLLVNQHEMSFVNDAV